MHQTHTIVMGREPAEEEASPTISAWCDPDDVKIACAESEWDAERRLARELSAPRPYHYRGRKNKCFFPTRKTRWRKG